MSDFVYKERWSGPSLWSPAKLSSQRPKPFAVCTEPDSSTCCHRKSAEPPRSSFYSYSIDKMTSSCGLLMMNTTPSLRQRSGLCASTSTTGGSFGSILSNWKKRDSSCSYTDRISLVGLARNPRVLQNLQAQRHKRQHLSIRFFRSKRFQHTVSKIIENDNTDGTETTVDNDLSETHTYDDPEELIVQKAESATSIVISESFETHYTVGRKVRTDL